MNSINLKFSSYKSFITYDFYLNMSTGYYEITSYTGILKDSGYTLSEPSLISPHGIINEFIERGIK